jgi:hypothetical protein
MLASLPVLVSSCGCLAPEGRQGSMQEENCDDIHRSSTRRSSRVLRICLRGDVSSQSRVLALSLLIENPYLREYECESLVGKRRFLVPSFLWLLPQVYSAGCPTQFLNRFVLAQCTKTFSERTFSTWLWSCDPCLGCSLATSVDKLCTWSFP